MPNKFVASCMWLTIAASGFVCEAFVRGYTCDLLNIIFSTIRSGRYHPCSPRKYKYKITLYSDYFNSCSLPQVLECICERESV